uniref:Uncharacterized protein n=1 Tax=Avena sativa TaxID=4498 RepID=A0ACD5WNE5_AVESA
MGRRDVVRNHLTIGGLSFSLPLPLVKRCTPAPPPLLLVAAAFPRLPPPLPPLNSALGIGAGRARLSVRGDSLWRRHGRRRGESSPEIFADSDAFFRAQKSGRRGAAQVCQICGDGVGVTAEGEVFAACDVCAFPVCRPCYEYERKDGTQACPQCKTKYKRHKGSPAIRGEEGDDTDGDEGSDFNYPASGTEDQKQKVADRMRSWRMSTGGSGNVGHPKYDSGEIGLSKYDSGEIPRGYIPSVTNSQISGEIPGASPDHHMMSPTGNIGKRVPFPYREYEEFKIRINGLVAKAIKVPEEGWIMQDGTPWPGNNTRDHPGMIQVFLGHSGGLDTEGNELPRLVYVSREKRPGFQHHKKAGAMNALVRVSAVLTNGQYMLNLDCDHYINNSKAIREAMCFLMDPNLGRGVCYVQFPQRFDGIDTNDRYANRNTVFFDINLRGLDGIQGPVYVGTGCVFNRTAIYGYEPPIKPKKGGFLSSLCGGKKKASKSKRKSSDKKKSNKHVDSSVPVFNLEDIEEGVEGAGFDDEKSVLMSQMSLEKRFGQSAAFVASTLMEYGGVPQSSTPESLLKEAIHVISCGYEDKSEWGTEIGWIYGSVTEDILTGFKMHARGWRSIYCMPKRPAFKGSAPINLSDRLNQVLRWALGSVEILFSRHCPLCNFSYETLWIVRMYLRILIEILLVVLHILEYSEHEVHSHVTISLRTQSQDESFSPFPSTNHETTFCKIASVHLNFGLSE